MAVEVSEIFTSVVVIVRPVSPSAEFRQTLPSRRSGFVNYFETTSTKFLNMMVVRKMFVFILTCYAFRALGNHFINEDAEDGSDIHFFELY